MEEIWKTVPEAIQYAVSNLGRVKNVKTGKILTPYVIGKTPTIKLQDAGFSICRSVPKLVTRLFEA